MQLVRIEPTELTLVGTRMTYQASGTPAIIVKRNLKLSKIKGNDAYFMGQVTDESVLVAVRMSTDTSLHK